MNISHYGYQRQVTRFALAVGRDFAFTRGMLRNNPALGPNRDVHRRRADLRQLLAVWHIHIGIRKPKTSDFEEALEIHTFIFLAQQEAQLNRQWKTSTIKLPGLLQKADIPQPPPPPVPQPQGGPQAGLDGSQDDITASRDKPIAINPRLRMQLRDNRHRVPPNMLFTNLTKQDPIASGFMPIFKTRK